MIYFGSHISPNIVFKNGKDATGGIICIGVPLARTGFQEYDGAELDEETRTQFGINKSDKVNVFRSPEEVFRRETLASFEGCTTTDQHPPERKMVTAEKFKELTCGHAQNIREGDKLASGERVMIGDLHIHDATLIDKILNKMQREISCGYNYRFQQMPDGSLAQIDIQGNHVAVVPSGRAGGEVYIHDSREESMAGETKAGVIGATGFKGIIARLLRMSAQHSTPEEFAEATQAMGPLLIAEDGKESSMAGEKDTTTGRLSEDTLQARAAALDARTAALDARASALDAKEARDDDGDDKKKGKDAEEMKESEDDDAHPEGCRCDAKPCMDKRKGKDAKKGKDKKASDGEESEEEGKKLAKPEEGDKSKDKKAKDAKKSKDDDDDDDEDEEEEEEKKEGSDSDIEPVEVLPPKDRGKNPITASDSALNAWGQSLKEWKKQVARGGTEQDRRAFNAALDAFNTVKKGARSTASQSGYDAFTELKKPNAPRNVNDVKPDAYSDWAGKDTAEVRRELAAKGGK